MHLRWCLSAARCSVGWGISAASPPPLLLHVSATLTSSTSHRALAGALAVASRNAATYPAPRIGAKRKGRKKTFNYLTGERLVRTERQSLTRMALRNRDDKALQRRRDYRHDVLRDVEEKIHYFSPEVKRYVFFPQSRSRVSRRIFRGSRVLPTRTFTRIYIEVMDRLVTKEERGKLVELMTAAGIEAPSAADFRRYSDATTGTITEPLVYSTWMERYFTELGRKYAAIVAAPRTPDGHLDTSGLSLSSRQAFILLHTGDEARVPSLAEWSHRQGKMNYAEELIESGRAQQTISERLVDGRCEVLGWGQTHIDAHLAPLTLVEQQALVDDAVNRFESAMCTLRDRLLFAAKVTLAIDSLPEVRAMQAPSKVYLREQALRAVVANGGLHFPTSTASLARWRGMSTEQQQSYFCFGRRAESRASSGLQLYARYCTRDYGLGRYESGKRFALLNDAQQAALNFPFYYPIAPRSSAVLAFRKFYREMCARYGLARGGSTLSVGNEVFEATMRQRWRLLSPEERAVYLRDDTVLAAFPLQPTGGLRSHGDNAEKDDEDVDGTAAPSSTSSVAPATEPDLLARAEKAERVAPARTRGRRGGKSTASRKGLYLYVNDGARGLQALHSAAEGRRAAEAEACDEDAESDDDASPVLGPQTVLESAEDHTRVIVV